MFGLPKNFDYSIFVGRELQSVWFCPYIICFSFDPKLALTLESSYAHLIDAASDEIRVDVPPTESTLMQLIGRTIERAEGEGAGTLVLHFSGGQVLKCFDDTPWYEAYQIECNGTTIII